MLPAASTPYLAAALFVLTCQASAGVAYGQEETQQDTLLVVLRWGTLETEPSTPSTAQEIRWLWNGTIIRLDTVSRFIDTVTVPAPVGNRPDTLVVAVWPIREGPPLFRRLRVLNASELVHGQRGAPPALILDLRRQMPKYGQSQSGSGPAPPLQSAGETYLSENFDDPTGLGITCAGGPCPLPERPYRKHSYTPNAGLDASGAINMHWQTGMSIGFSPVWIRSIPHSRHFRVRYAVRQTAEMKHSGSAQKLHRIRSDNTFIGTLESKNGKMVWYWEGWTGNKPVSAVQLGIAVPADSKWHIYEMELDYRDTARLAFTFWLDGRHVKTLYRNSLVGDLMKDHRTLTFSPFTEMYSCGDSGACSAAINTGDYTVDDFSVTLLSQ